VAEEVEHLGVREHEEALVGQGLDDDLRDVAASRTAPAAITVLAATCPSSPSAIPARSSGVSTPMGHRQETRTPRSR
jgi:hypothetical protein